MGSRWEMPRRPRTHHNDPAASRSTRLCPRAIDLRSVAFSIFPRNRIKCRTVSLGSRGDWPKRKCWYAILPRFDPDGDPLGPKALFADTTAGGEPEVGPRAGEKWCEMLSKRGEVRSGDVEVKRFSVEVDGPTSAWWTRRITTPIVTRKRGSNA